jgi:peptidyl-prolyl cis-trans isomerase A (cyclophilin A)
MKQRFSSRRRPVQSAALQPIQWLEQRLLLSYTIDPNSAVVMDTSLGEVTVQLYDDMPITTANFLSYVTSGAYNGTIFHRTATQSSSGIGIVQGGGFAPSTLVGTGVTQIPTNAPITNEWTANHPNNAGTIAMARTSQSLDSATSQFYFNTTDNPALDDAADNNQYADFGDVIRGLGIIDTVNNLSTSNSVGVYDSNGNPIEVTNSDGSSSQETINPPETSSGGYVTINSATEEDSMTITLGPNDAAGDRTVTFKDPASGALATISLSGGDATLIFTGTLLSAQRTGHNLLVTGTNLEFQSVQSSDTTASSRLSISTHGGPRSGNYVNIGNIDISGSIGSIIAPTGNLTGDISVGGGIQGIKLLAAGGGGLSQFTGIDTEAGVINLDYNSVSKVPPTAINIPYLANVAIESNGKISGLTSFQYLMTDGTGRTASAPAISKATIEGTMNATLDAGKFANVKIGTMSGELDGNSFSRIKIGSLTGLLQSYSIHSAVFDQISGGEILAYNNGAFDPKALQIKSLIVRGSISNATILAGGNIGYIETPSMDNSAIMAGVDPTMPSTSSLPTSFIANAGYPAGSTITDENGNTIGTLATDLSQGSPYSILSLSSGITTALAAGSIYTVTSSDSTQTTQNFTIVPGANAGATLLSPTAFTANAKIEYLRIKNKKGVTDFSNNRIAAYDLGKLHLGVISTTAGNSSTNGVLSTHIGSMQLGTSVASNHNRPVVHSATLQNITNQTDAENLLARHRIALNNSFAIDILSTT